MAPDEKRPEKPKRDSFGLTEANYRWIMWVVTGVWGASNILGMVSAGLDLNYEPPGEINAIFLAIVGGAFIARTRVSNDDDK